jgi:Type II CAAX prenyl endopeptidase Rce1-like
MSVILKSFLQPVYIIELDFRDKLKNFKRAILFILKGYGLLVGIIMFDLLQYQLSSHYLILNAFKTHQGFGDKSLTDFFLWIVIVGPVVEELTFRSFMDTRRITVSLSMGLLFFVFLRILNLVVFNIDWYIELLSGFFLAVFLFFTLPNKLFAYVSDNFRLFFFGMNVFFVSLHISNYDINSFSYLNYLFLPIILLPQTILSICCSYIRIKNGLTWSILLHTLNNSLPWLAMVFFKHR